MKVLLAMLLCAVPVFGQSFVERPQPRTADKQFWIAASTLGVGWTMDTISTAQRIGWCNEHSGYQLHCVENGGFFNGTRETAKIVTAWAAVDVGVVVLSYEWKKHVHNKYLHPLWRVPLFVGAAEHTRAAAGNWSY